MADYFIEQGLNQGWNPVGAPRGLYGGKRSPLAKCKHCGSTAVKWRLDAGGWRLYDEARVHPGNYKPLHHCATSAEGFGDVDES